jgi:predicted NBD/HSP70 family sugar kinase
MAGLAYIGAHVKNKNRRTVYDLLLAERELSKAEISRRTAISVPTVLKITQFLLEKGFVEESGEGISTLGRKPQLLRFVDNARFSIGVNFEGDVFTVGLVDLCGKITRLVVEESFTDLGTVLETRLETVIRDLIANSGIDQSLIVGACIGVPGAVDAKASVVDFAPLVGILKRRAIGAELGHLGARLGFPFAIENDANAAALGEFRARGLGPDDDLFYVSLGTGLGAGLVLNGRLRQGARNLAGEIGYSVFDPCFVSNSSKAGWLENRINLKAIADLLGLAPETMLKADAIGLRQEMKAKGILGQVASDLALCIANAVVLLDVERVVVGGLLPSFFGEDFMEELRSAVNNLCVSAPSLSAPASAEPCVVGTATIALESMLSNVLSDEND